MKIRIAKRSDLEYILPLFKELDTKHVESSKDVKSTIPKERYGLMFNKIFKKDSTFILTIAIENDEVLGFALGNVRKVENRLIFVDQVIGEILYVTVKEKYKRRGIGKKIMQDLEFRLKKRGVNKFELKVFGFNKETIPEKINYRVKYTIYEKYF